MVENPLRKAEADHAIVARTHCNEKCHFRVFEFLETLIQVFLVFRKFTLHHFPFMKDLHWHLCSVSEKFEEDFHFYGKKKKRQKAKKHSEFILQQAIIEAAQTQSRQNGPGKLLPQKLYSALSIRLL